MSNLLTNALRPSRKIVVNRADRVAHRREVVQLGDAVPGVELQRVYVELVERVLSRVPVDDAARAVDVRASFLRTRNADGEERNAKALKCGIAVAPGPERTRRLRWRRGLLAREP